MAVGKALKLSGLVGGGVLAFAGGAMGFHLAKPHLEKHLNPERKDREIQLNQSLVEKNEEVVLLGEELEKQGRSSESQKQQFFDLFEGLSKLNEQVSEKQSQIKIKDAKIEEQERQLNEKKEEHQRQSAQIQSLESSLRVKNNEITSVTSEKTNLQGQLKTIRDKLSLTNEDILTPEALKVSSLNIDVWKIEHKEFKDGKAIFETDKRAGGKVTFRVKYDGNLPDREEKMKHLKTKGISFGLDQSFDTWEKTISLNRWDVKYEEKVTEASKNRNFSINKDVKEFKISDYFDSKYLEDAFKVLIAIGQMDDFPLCLELNSSQENLFNFCPNMKDSQDYSKTNSLYWKAFKGEDINKEKLEIWTNRFKTTDGFMGYWFKKTVEFIRIGTVDFSDFLNPILLSKNYQSA